MNTIYEYEVYKCACNNLYDVETMEGLSTDDMVECFETDGFAFLFESALENIKTPKELLAFMKDHVPIAFIHTFMMVCDAVGSMVDNRGWVEMGQYKPSKVTMELYGMCTMYPNCTQKEVVNIISSVLGYVCTGDMHATLPDVVQRKVVELWMSIDYEEEIVIVDVLAKLRVILATYNNERTSQFAIMWSENYELVGECMSTWLPAEMMEDVAWLSGYGVYTIPIPSM